jgi:transposase-like protein
VLIKINAKQHRLWRAVDQDGEVVGVYLQDRRDGAPAKRFLKCVVKRSWVKHRTIVADKLASYGFWFVFLEIGTRSIEVSLRSAPEDMTDYRS